jgi:Mg/Co/Ni transporter MgtE
MNDFIIKYFISSVIKKNYDNAIMDITTLKNYYQDYDLNIYIYLLKMINGSSITESAESLKNISLNVYEEVWKIVSEEDFAFYAIITLLLNFKRSFLKEIQIVNQSLVNKILEDNSDYYELLEHYTKCKYEDLIENFDKMKLRMANDPLLSKNLMKIIYDFKNNILKEILQATSCIKISKLSLILRENENYVENWILTGISNGNIKVKIDDVDKIIYSREVSTKNECVRSTNEFSFKTYSNSLKIIMSSISAKNVELKNVKFDDLRKYYFEKSKNDNYDDDYMKMV